MFYVYCLINPKDNKIFYVGMGSGKRMYVHVNKVLQNKPPNNNWKLFRTIKSILDEGLDVEYNILANGLEHKKALELENKTILDIGLDNLCNLNYGGTGRLPGYKHSMETRKKIANSNTGKIKSEHTKKLIGMSKIGNKNMLGKKLSNEARKKLSDSWKTRDLTNYKFSQTHRRKQVIQLDLNGNVIKIWESITEAIKQNGKSVGDAIYGRQKTAHGYIWKIQQGGCDECKYTEK